MEINITIKDVESVDIIFNDKTCLWEDNAMLNKKALIITEKRAKTYLKLRGHIFLNEVYDMLGYKRTPLGAIMGWVYDKDKELSFGLTKEYLNNPTVDVPLHFNIDGVIVNKI